MSRNLPLLFIFLPLLIDAIGIGLMIPVLPELIGALTGEGIGGAALWGGVLTTAFAAMQFLFGPTLGNVSDRWGRRPVLLISLAVMGTVYLAMGLTGSIWLLLAARILAGIAAATQSTAMAYIADISAAEDKAANFGLFGAAFGIGFVLGPLAGGLLGELGIRAPFFAAAALAGLNLAFGYFALPESVTDATRRAFDWRRANPLGALRAVSSLPGAGLLLAFAFLAFLSSVVYPAIWPYFGAERFGWGPGMIGLSLGIYGISMALTQGLLVRPVLRRLGERRTVLLGLALRLFSFLFLGLAGIGWLVLALTPISALGGIEDPALQGILSRRAPDDAQGELQGVMASLNAIATIVAPLALTGVFAFFSGPDAPIYLPGAPFLISFLLSLASLPFFLAAMRGERRGET